MSNATAVLPVHTIDQMADRAAEHVPDYRLTRRGRLVVFVLGFAILLAIGIALAGGSVATGDKEATQTIVVAPGQTLWGIAADVAEDGDVREMMAHIEQLNSLDSVVLDAGQRLRLPAED